MNHIKKIIPSYAIIPLICVLSVNFIAYGLSKLIVSDATHYSLLLPIDKKFPFVPEFVIIYIAAFAQWIIGFLLIAQEGKEFCHRFFSAEITAKLICFIFFLFFPTMISRPEITDTDLYSRLCAMIYSVDTPVNCFPSVHCLESWVCLRSAFKLTKTARRGKGYKYAYIIYSAFMTLAVFASVVLIKQHFFLDIIGGIAVFEIGMFICRKTGSYRIFRLCGSKMQQSPEGTRQ